MIASLQDAVQRVVTEHQRSAKSLAIIMAGHNGSGKSTLWHQHLAPTFEIPLVNADRMMMSILPDPPLPRWAVQLRDKNDGWMAVAQNGVNSFVGHASTAKVPFAVETVFSHWRPLGNGHFESKIDLIKDLQAKGYFVLLVFVGLANLGLSILRVQSRKMAGGHAVDHKKLVERYPRTQTAIQAALPVVDAAILTDNSRGTNQAFTLSLVQLGRHIAYDIRDDAAPPPEAVQWLNIVSPRNAHKSD